MKEELKSILGVALVWTGGVILVQGLVKAEWGWREKVLAREKAKGEGQKN